MSENLIYNGDFSQGTTSWAGTNLSVSNGVCTCTGNLSQSSGGNIYVPVSSSYQYKLTFDLKITSDDGSHNFYICLQPQDNKKSYISPSYTNDPIGSGANTTLAAALNNGDTTVTLTDGSKWSTGSSTTNVGICSSLAWGYGRATQMQGFSSRSGNTVTLRAAWSKGSFAAGTKVKQFNDGSVYYYPITIAHANLPTTWTTYTHTFYGGNTMRYSCQYFVFSTLGYSHTYQIRNIRLECLNAPQRAFYGNPGTIHTLKNGQLTATNFDETSMRIRYIRDTTAGNSVNTDNHWNEIQVFNTVGENIAWGKDVKLYLNGTLKQTFTNSVATDGVINAQYIYISHAGANQAVIDLGFVEDITQIKIWHYYSDGRTYYSNRTEVSVDGTNWYTVYFGQKPETINGNIITLSSQYAAFQKRGIIYTNELYEY